MVNSGPFISAQELSTALASDATPVILDASLVLHRPQVDGDFRADSGRSAWEAAHLPGALHVQVDTDLSIAAATHNHHPPPQDLADRLARFGIGADTPTVVYDSTGGFWAARTWYLLRWIGIPVRVLDGGLDAWRAAGLPVESGSVPARPVASWSARPIREAWIDLDELREIQCHAGNLVCALSPPAFSGIEPTRYTRRGHIPGSVNVPARELFDDRGLVRPPADIRERYRDAGTDLDREVLLYCGGGISATANALALASCGVESVRVYDGSLEEWSADPTLPLQVDDTAH
ncbi:sulfurtransferase [Mycobacterium sp. SMC-18]|uniref:sulfurtransferase n=1 Tax=Mycobacteriaceae TaxID=1762 RepID=UPI001BB3267C|nr:MULTISPECIES: sulfurtransferase [unclassified Mycolicibacterium]MDX1880870.1 sulfurtransferase [Mycolicibacterium sp. 141076]BCI80233.1 sulfurtransferase [Mycolicibacterium sp. TY66]BCJ82103.1 sulfurtransferase [Mycolicibacterium sp. TY81]